MHTFYDTLFAFIVLCHVCLTNMQTWEKADEQDNQYEPNVSSEPHIITSKEIGISASDNPINILKKWWPVESRRLDDKEQYSTVVGETDNESGEEKREFKKEINEVDQANQAGETMLQMLPEKLSVDNVPNKQWYEEKRPFSNSASIAPDAPKQYGTNNEDKPPDDFQNQDKENQIVVQNPETEGKEQLQMTGPNTELDKPNQIAQEAQMQYLGPINNLQGQPNQIIREQNPQREEPASMSYNGPNRDIPAVEMQGYDPQYDNPSSSSNFAHPDQHPLYPPLYPPRDQPGYSQYPHDLPPSPKYPSDVQAPYPEPNSYREGNYIREVLMQQQVIPSVAPRMPLSPPEINPPLLPSYNNPPNLFQKMPPQPPMNIGPASKILYPVQTNNLRRHFIQTDPPGQETRPEQNHKHHRRNSVPNQKPRTPGRTIARSHVRPLVNFRFDNPRDRQPEGEYDNFEDNWHNYVKTYRRYRGETGQMAERNRNYGWPRDGPCDPVFSFCDQRKKAYYFKTFRSKAHKQTELGKILSKDYGTFLKSNQWFIKNTAKNFADALIKGFQVLTLQRSFE